MHLTITEIHVGPLTNMVKKLLLMDSSVYLNVSEDRLYSHTFIPSKDVAKTSYVDLTEVMEFESNEIPLVKVSLFSGQKLIECLKYFDPHNLRGELHYYEEGDEYYAEKIVLQDPTTEITIHCADVTLGFTTMSDTQINAAFGNDSELYHFQLSQEMLTKVNNLITLDKNELFSIYSNSKGVHIKGDTYDVVVDDDITTENQEVHLFKSFLNRIDRENYAVSVCPNKLVLDSQDSNTRIALNLAIKA